MSLPSSPIFSVPSPNRGGSEERAGGVSGKAVCGYNSRMLFLGLDLAWGRKNTTGGVALVCDARPGSRASVLDVTEALGDDDAIVDWIQRWDAEAGGGGLLLGVDAPLVVPNLTGKRPCETELGRRFAKYQAGAHPANRTIFKDDVRGERLVKRLAENGITDNPYLTEPRQAGRTADDGSVPAPGAYCLV